MSPAPINALFSKNTTLRGSCGSPTKGPPVPCHKLSHTIVPFVMDRIGPDSRPAEKGSAPVYIKICWRPTWEPHYAHFSCIRHLTGPRQYNAAVLSGTGPSTVLTETHKWELTSGIERGIFHFTYPHREMCWAGGNVYIGQSDAFFFFLPLPTSLEP